MTASPPQGGPRAINSAQRTPRMVGTVSPRALFNCGAVLSGGFDPNGQCPKCAFELHSCKQCRFFDSGAQFECTQPVPSASLPKDAKNTCKFYEFRTTV